MCTLASMHHGLWDDPCLLSWGNSREALTKGVELWGQGGNPWLGWGWALNTEVEDLRKAERRKSLQLCPHDPNHRLGYPHL